MGDTAPPAMCSHAIGRGAGADGALGGMGGKAKNGAQGKARNWGEKKHVQRGRVEGGGAEEPLERERRHAVQLKVAHG